jgi:hypothetical protein
MLNKNRLINLFNRKKIGRKKVLKPISRFEGVEQLSIHKMIEESDVFVDY